MTMPHHLEALSLQNPEDIHFARPEKPPDLRRNYREVVRNPLLVVTVTLFPDEAQVLRALKYAKRCSRSSRRLRGHSPRVLGAMTSDYSLTHPNPYVRALNMALEDFSRASKPVYPGQSVEAWAAVQFPGCRLTWRQAKSLQCGENEKVEAARLRKRRRDTLARLAKQQAGSATDEAPSSSPAAGPSSQPFPPGILVESVERTPEDHLVLPRSNVPTPAPEQEGRSTRLGFDAPSPTSPEGDNPTPEESLEVPEIRGTEYAIPGIMEEPESLQQPLLEEPPSPLTDIADEPDFVHGPSTPEYVDVKDHQGGKHRVYLPYAPSPKGRNLFHVECEQARDRLLFCSLTTDTESPDGFVRIMHHWDEAEIAKAFSQGRPVVVKGYSSGLRLPEPGESLADFFWRSYRVLPSRQVTLQSMRNHAAMYASLEKNGALYPPANAQPTPPPETPQAASTKDGTIGKFWEGIDAGEDTEACLEIWMRGQDSGLPEIQAFNHGFLATANRQDPAYGSLAYENNFWSMGSHAHYLTSNHQDSEGLGIWTRLDWGTKIWSVANYIHSAKELFKMGFRFENILLQPADAYAQVPGMLHLVMTPVSSFARGGSFYNFTFIHLTEAARKADVLHQHLTTNADADNHGVYGVLAAMLAELPHLYARAGPLHMRPLFALCLMLLVPEEYAINNEDLSGNPVYKVTIWRAVRLAWHLGLDEGLFPDFEMPSGCETRVLQALLPRLREELDPKHFKDLYDPGEVWEHVDNYACDALLGERERLYERPAPPDMQSAPTKKRKALLKETSVSAGKPKRQARGNGVLGGVDGGNDMLMAEAEVAAVRKSRKGTARTR
ncbi:hypothetical protein CYLTODRAFT_447441 [Cylindrobasidium torrendii FP15055 ss-10]|uniref:JmjC domain-containing protein n=1 Tax=Cylindrobasidium torrendii FP15055 ss-10 TaxID=1314674 RepID=A0A0D7AXL0_9AGAR|nr:hypothetical protein CYLTODRAFT_447441 [Cylindrobasidium torrendii FP15055 ss-10]